MLVDLRALSRSGHGMAWLNVGSLHSQRLGGSWYRLRSRQTRLRRLLVCYQAASSRTEQFFQRGLGMNREYLWRDPPTTRSGAQLRRLQIAAVMDLAMN